MFIFPPFCHKTVNTIVDNKGRDMISDFIIDIFALVIVIMLMVFPIFVVLQISFMIATLIMWPISKVMIKK